MACYNFDVAEQENIDTSRKAGTNPENTPDWQKWAGKRLPELRVLKSAGILASKNREWRNVGEHLLVTNALAVFLGDKLAEAGVNVDLGTINKASLLHDATKRIEKEKNISREHGESMISNFLVAEGYSVEVAAAAEYTGRVPEIFIEDPEKQKEAIENTPLEWLVIAYADARIRNTDIVTLEEARDLNKEKIPADTEFYDQWFTFYSGVEERIIREIGDPDFNPGSINNEAVVEMVKAS